MKTISKQFKFNKVIAYLTLSDIFTWGVITVVNAIAGLYLSKKIDGDTIAVVGFGTALFSLARGGAQIPIGLITDKIKKDHDDILFLFIASIFLGIPYLFYPFIETPGLYYFFQIIVGLGAAMNLVTWRKLFAGNLDLHKEGLEYAVYDTVMSCAIAIFSIIAGLLATVSGELFDIVMVSLGILILTSGFWALSLYRVRDRKTV